MSFFDGLLAFVILGGIGLWIYSRMSNKSMTEAIKGIIESLKSIGGK
jgi:hypothetical protein